MATAVVAVFAFHFVPSCMLIVSCSLLVSIRTERPEDTSVLATVVLVACLCDGVTNRKASLPSFWTW